MLGANSEDARWRGLREWWGGGKVRSIVASGLAFRMGVVGELGSLSILGLCGC